MSYVISSRQVLDLARCDGSSGYVESCRTPRLRLFAPISISSPSHSPPLAQVQRTVDQIASDSDKAEASGQFENFAKPGDFYVYAFQPLAPLNVTRAEGFELQV